MLEDLTANWINGLFFFDVTHYMPSVANLWDKQLFHTQYADNTKVKKPDVLLGYMVLFWLVLYFLYEKCLNSLLRRMRVPLMQRNRIIEAIWNCGFCVGSICYLKSSMIRTQSFHSIEEQVTYEQLGVIFHKSFYFHRAGIEIFQNGVWIKALANLLFALYIMNPYQQKWCTIVSTLLFYKAIDTIIINVCRILLCISHLVGRQLPKIVFWFHAVNWIYLYAVFVPKLMLYSEDYTKPQFGLWLWFLVECLDSVWFRFIGCARATYWLDICLFPPPTQEAIQLAHIQKKHKEALRNSANNKIARKTQMWQTLMCVMAIKNKVKRMRKAKEEEFSHHESEDIMQKDAINSNTDKCTGHKSTDTADQNERMKFVNLISEPSYTTNESTNVEGNEIL